MKKTARDRGQTRTKAEKVRPPTVPVPQVEIVPGRLNEAEWIALVSIEEGEDVVGDILAELLARVMDAAFKIYLTQQCIPFTISQAREAMLQITEWRFLARDEGETDVAEDPTWGEDEEPRASTTDTWAQGSVPVLHAPSPPIPPGLEPISQPEGTECSEQLPLHQKTWISCSEEQSLSFWEPLELGPTPGPPPTPELSSQSPQHFVLPHPCLDSAPNSYPCLSMWESSQISLETSSPMSPHPSLDMYLWGSSQAPLTSQPTYVRSPQPTPRSSFHPQGGGDTQDQMEEADLPSPYYLSVPLPPFLASPPWGLPKSRPLPAQVPSLSPTLLPAASAKFMRLQLGRSYLAPGLVYDKMGQIIAMDPLDPTHLPQHQIQPLAKVVVPDAEVHPLESYKEQRKHVKYGKKLNFKLPAHRRPIPNFHRGFHFPSPGLPFLTPVLELQSRHFTPKQWSNIQWPSGLERKTDLLQMQPVGSSLMSTMESGKRPSPDLSTLPHHGTRVLEATSQLMWKPSSLLDTMKLMPNVSLWNPSKNTHRSGFIPSHREREKTLGPLSEEPSEQRPIQTHALNPQVTVAQLLKGSPPKVRALPSQEALNTTFPEEA
ncbi:uncharacterized protein C2orf81 homolog isoform X2 [Monodelphis domestica]|uniref:uncharacterized protein C2orf81 homolog isoform X2 n=1 Tax=Monodelphis domestica TaxID=13616 RepID=UPI000443682E|nr:uncharacterized protein C2orf81 homolog isoform X2 [Monodelphis domestica]